MQYDIWFILFALMGLLMIFVTIMKRGKKQKILRVSPRSIDASRGITVRYLPLVEDDQDTLLNEHSLPCNKEQIKSALKVMAYCFSRKRKHQDLARIKRAYISLHRFQEGDLMDEEVIAAAQREKKYLVRDIEDYLSKHFG